MEIDLAKIGHNARTLVERLGARGIAVTGVTKATLGSVRIANALLAAGVRGLGDSRVENLEVLRQADVAAKLTLIRTPMLSQVARVVAHADLSLNSEPAVLEQLSRAAQERGVTHAVALMVEMATSERASSPPTSPTRCGQRCVCRTSTSSASARTSPVAAARCPTSRRWTSCPRSSSRWRWRSACTSTSSPVATRPT